MFNRTLFTGFFVAIVGMSFGWHAPAGAQGTVLRGSALNQKSLIEALTPLPPGVRTRGLTVRKKSSAAGSASLLITFKVNSAEISDSAKSELDIVAGALKSDELARFKFSIEGHADPRGESQFNLQLSQRRAESVVDYLTARHQLPPDRLIPIGKGDRELMRPDQPAAAENRRVTIKTEVN